jgi:polar amino acid transport system substrate-binding protein
MHKIWRNARLAKNRVNTRIRSARPLVAGAAALAMTAMMAAGCGSADDAKGGTLARFEKSGVVKVGYANEAPYAYKKDGNLTGMNMELMKAFFKEHDIKVEGEQVDFAGLIPGLLAKRYDVVGAGMYILPDRCAAADFGPPEYQVGTAFAVPKGNPLGIHSYADVAKSQAVYATSSGVAEIEYAEVAGVPKNRIKTFPSYADAAAALVAGRVDVMAQQQTGLHATLNALNSDKVEYVELAEQPKDKTGATAVGYGGSVFPKDADDLREAYGEWLTNARKDGSYQKIMKEFGFTEENIPPDGLTAEDLCKGNTPQ